MLTHADLARTAGEVYDRGDRPLATEIKVPALGESVTSATVARWIKQPGEAVAADEPLVELETDKVTVEVNAPVAGVLTRSACRRAPRLRSVPCSAWSIPAATQTVAGPAANPLPGVRPPPRPVGPVARSGRAAKPRRPRTRPAAAPAPLPAAAKMMEERHVVAETIGAGTGKDGRITKGDVLEFLNRPAAAPAPPPAPAAPRAPDAREERVRMTRLRRTIAARLEGGAEQRRHADHLQ